MDDLVRRFDNRESEEMFEQRKCANRHITKAVYEHIKKEMDITQAQETAIAFLAFVERNFECCYADENNQFFKPREDFNQDINPGDTIINKDALWGAFLESQI